MTKIAAARYNRYAHHVLHHGEPRRGQQSLGHVFVHLDGRGQHARAHVGHAGHLEQALQDAVLPAAAVDDGEDHIQRLRALHLRLGLGARPGSGQHRGGVDRAVELGDENRLVAGRGRQSHRRSLHRSSRRQGGRPPPPATPLVHGDQRDVVALSIECLQNRGRGSDGDFVLHRAASEQKPHA